MKLLLEELDVSDLIKRLTSTDIAHIRDVVLQYVESNNAYLPLLQVLSSLKLPIVFRDESERDKFLEDIVQTDDETIIPNIEQYKKCDTLNKALTIINLSVLVTKHIDACRKFLVKIFDSLGNNLTVYKELV